MAANTPTAGYAVAVVVAHVADSVALVATAIVRWLRCGSCGCGSGGGDGGCRCGETYGGTCRFTSAGATTPPPTP